MSPPPLAQWHPDPTHTPHERLLGFISLVSNPNYHGHEAPVFRLLRSIHSTLTPSLIVTARLTIPASFCQGIGSMHGGATATIFDVVTTLPFVLIWRKDFWALMGVSRGLSVTYLEAVREGDEVEVEGEVVSLGKRLATVRGVMRKVEGGKVGKIVATCEHLKVETGGLKL